MSEEQQPNVDANLELEAISEAPEGDHEAEANENPFKEFMHHQRLALEELGRAVESLLPKDFREHTRNAGKAFTDSFRSLADATREAFENITHQGEESAENKEGKEPTATKIKVELD